MEADTLAYDGDGAAWEQWEVGGRRWAAGGGQWGRRLLIGKKHVYLLFELLSVAMR